MVLEVWLDRSELQGLMARKVLMELQDRLDLLARPDRLDLLARPGQLDLLVRLGLLARWVQSESPVPLETPNTTEPVFTQSAMDSRRRR